VRGSLLSYTERAKHCPSALAAQFLRLMDEKQTNLALSADVTKSDELLALAEQLGPAICLLKTHIDIISDFTPQLTKRLMELAKQHRFLIFEDRKFADIGNTVKHQYEGGIYRIADWADIINAHSLPGPGIVKGLAEVGLTKHRALLLLAEMSSAGHLMNADYAANTLAIAESFPEFVIGFITQHALSTDPHWIYLTPGVQFNGSGDKLGQQYISPEHAILERGNDVIIVGRGILAADDRVKAAKKYRDSGFNAYLQRCGGK